MAELRKATGWLRVLDQAVGWGANFADDKDKKRDPFIVFPGIVSANVDLGDGRSMRGWEGWDELVLPRALAIEMMDWLRDHARVELKKLGVKK